MILQENTIKLSGIFPKLIFMIIKPSQEFTSSRQESFCQNNVLKKLTYLSESTSAEVSFS